MCIEAKILATAFCIETQSNSNGFQQRRLTRTIFADKKSHFRMWIQLCELNNGRQRKRV